MRPTIHDKQSVMHKYSAAVVSQISKAMKVSAMMVRACVVRSNMAITLTMAECLTKFTSTPAKGGSIKGSACGQMMSCWVKRGDIPKLSAASL